MAMPDRVRTIVTHINDDGTSGMTEHINTTRTIYDEKTGRPVFQGAQIWGTQDGEIAVGSSVQRDAVFEPFFPGPGGHRFVIFSHMPDDNHAPAESLVPVSDRRDPEAIFPGLMTEFDPERPGMHTTNTIDYVTLLSGRVYLELDSGEVLLNPGDTVVMRGTAHAWHVRALEPSLVATVLIGVDRK